MYLLPKSQPTKAQSQTRQSHKLHFRKSDATVKSALNTHSDNLARLSDFGDVSDWAIAALGIVLGMRLLQLQLKQPFSQRSVIEWAIAQAGMAIALLGVWRGGAISFSVSRQ